MNGHQRAAGVLVCALLAAALNGSCEGAKKSRILPPDVSAKPYVAQHGRAEKFAVWIVDGRYVRENLDEEFTNFGQHYRFRFIPPEEFWLDRENTPGEAGFFVRHLLVEHRLMARGLDYDRALGQADAAEKLERSRTRQALEGEELLRSGRQSELIERIHKQLLQQYSRDVKVWVVSGELVRSLLFIDFTEGGHDKVYDFIPEKEVWLDDDVMPEEHRFILLHEMNERSLMSRGWNYPKAHKNSSGIEFYCRRHPEQLDAKLKEAIEKNLPDNSTRGR